MAVDTRYEWGVAYEVIPGRQWVAMALDPDERTEQLATEEARLASIEFPTVTFYVYCKTTDTKLSGFY
jgi:hypothetical protein